MQLKNKCSAGRREVWQVANYLLHCQICWIWYVQMNKIRERINHIYGTLPRKALNLALLPLDAPISGGRVKRNGRKTSIEKIGLLNGIFIVPCATCVCVCVGCVRLWKSWRRRMMSRYGGLFFAFEFVYFNLRACVRTCLLDWDSTLLVACSSTVAFTLRLLRFRVRCTRATHPTWLSPQVRQIFKVSTLGYFPVSFFFLLHFASSTFENTTLGVRLGFCIWCVWIVKIACRSC